VLDLRGWATCEVVPLSGPPCADEGDPCTADVCREGVCAHEALPDCSPCAVPCDGPCQTGACDAAGGCVPRDDETPCEDGNPRTEGDTCRSGQCVGGCGSLFAGCRTFVLDVVGGGCGDVIYAEAGSPCLADADLCTADVCDADGNCLHVPGAAGAACTHPCGPGTCDAAGVCQLDEDRCAQGVGWSDAKCWSAACDEAARQCVRQSEHATCLHPGARCQPELGLCDAGFCGDGWCAGSELVVTDNSIRICPDDCQGRCQNGSLAATDCLLRFPQMRFVGAWRAHQSPAYGWTLGTAHQTQTLSGMLDDGIRWLHLVVDYCEAGATDGALCLCAGDDDCAADSVPFGERLSEIAVWMGANTADIVVLQLEEFVSDEHLRTAFADAGLTRFLYRRTSGPGTYEPWPMTVRQMIGGDRRLVVFAEPFLSPRNLFVAERFTLAEGEPEVTSIFGDLFTETRWPCADGTGHLPTETDTARGTFTGVYVVRHLVKEGGLTSWSEAACYNVAGRVHETTCAATYPVTAVLYQFYNSSSVPLAGVPNGHDYPNRCIHNVTPCQTTADCDGGVCGGVGICVNCVTDADCPAAQYCDTALGACLPDQMDGAPCVSASQCASGNCRGTCWSCATHADCDAGEWCDVAGICQPVWPNGHSCLTSAECASGACFFGACAACDGHDDCPTGEFCTLDPLGGRSACAPAKEAGAPCTDPRECADGACRGFVCSDCTDDAACAATEFCDVWVCRPTFELGHACAAPRECQSDACYLNACVACDSQDDCAGDTYCTLAPLAQSACAARKPNGEPCGSAFECTGGSCTFFVCGDCVDDGQCAPAENCNALNQCAPDVGNNESCLRDAQCTTGHCSAGFCAECTGDEHCPAAEHCDAFGDCQPDVGDNESCLRDAQCLSGHCSVGFCAACALDEHCPEPEHCDLFGDCQPDVPNNAACLRDAQCLTGRCSAGFCAQCTAHADCGGDAWCDAGGDCHPKSANGTACASPVECLSGTCTLFVCGECADDGQCPASENCDASNNCAPDVGNNQSCLRDSQCTTGHCVAGLCAQCVGDEHCPAAEHCDAFGDCRPDVGNNASCLRDTQCTTGFCVAGFCAWCRSHADCGANGWCDVGGDCQTKFANGHACGSAAECTAGACTLFVCGECVNDGNCPASENCDAFNNCAPDVGNNEPCLRDAQCTTGHCSAGICAECTSDSHCPASEHCDAFGDCAPDVPNNASCLRDAQCLTGICSVGFCAECLGDYHCPASENCDAWGDCAPDVGNNESCLRDAQCITGICSAGFCAWCTTHDHCGASGWCDAGGDCQPKFPNGHACGGAVECQTNCRSFWTCGGFGC